MFIHRSRKIGTTNGTNNDSYKVLARLNDSICSNNIEEFKKIYETEYICNPEICDHFRYEDENNNWWVNSYSLCTCPVKEPDHIHRNMNVRQCNCVDGKRYLAYLFAFNAHIGCIHNDTNIHNDKKLEEMNTEIKTYLMNDGPIDLTYTQFYYEKK